MRTKSGILAVMSAVVWLVAIAALPARAGDDEKSDQEKINGTWRVKTMTVGDDEIPGDVANKFTYTFDGKKASSRGKLISNGGRYLPAVGVDQYNLVLGKSGDLKTIDLKPTAAGKKTMQGIYEFDGDTLKICMSYTGKRPKTFVAKEPGVGLLTLERDKK